MGSWSGPVEVSAEAIADSEGVAVARFRGPGVTYRQIAVSSIQVASTSTLRPTVGLFRGSSSNRPPMATERDGISGSFAGNGKTDVLRGTDVWTLEWTGATPGSVCSATLVGFESRVNR